MSIKHNLALLLFCTTGISYTYAGVSEASGDTRTQACAQAKRSASSVSDYVSSSCDCSKRDNDAYPWVCSVDWEPTRSRRSSYQSSYPDRSSSSSSDDSPSRFEQTTPPGQRFVPIQIPQRPIY